MKSISKISYLMAGVASIVPSFAFAAGQGLDGIITLVGNIIGKIIPIIIAIAVVMFLWGVLKYVTAKDEDGHKEAIHVMISGIVVLFVMVSIWGLVNILSETLGLSTTAIPNPPGIPGYGTR